MSEQLNPQESVEGRSEYCSEIVTSIERNNGVVTQFQGDAVLAIFNVPREDELHSLNAVNTARGLIKVVEENTVCGRNLSCRIGITTGNVVDGNV